MTRFLSLILIAFFILLGSFMPVMAAPVSDGHIFDKVRAAIESDGLWEGGSVEVSDLDLSALARSGGNSRLTDFDAVDVKPLGQVRPGKRFTMRVVFLKGAEPLADILATARISFYKDVVVAARSLRIRDRIGAGDVRIERMQLRDINVPVFISMADVVGMRVRRPVRAGSYIKRDYIQPETLVRRGDKVIIVADNGVLKIRSKARALEDGYSGSVVEARTTGGKVIFGTVTRSGELAVSF